MRVHGDAHCYPGRLGAVRWRHQLPIHHLDAPEAAAWPQVAVLVDDQHREDRPEVILEQTEAAAVNRRQRFIPPSMVVNPVPAGLLPGRFWASCGAWCACLYPAPPGGSATMS
jgi:hypothetical protein